MTRPEVQQITDGGERSFSRVMHRRTGAQAMTVDIHGTRKELTEFIVKQRVEIERLRADGRGLHKAYLRLRGLIPGAFDTPHAPTPEQVWETTENALRRALETKP